MFVFCLLSQSFAQTTNIGLSFDGTDDRVTIPDHAAYNLGTGAFTVEAWVKANLLQSASSPVIISNRENPNSVAGFLVYLVSGRVSVYVAGTSLGLFGNDLRDNNCHHIAIAHVSLTNNYRIYIDGANVGNVGVGAPLLNINSNHAFWIGREDPATVNSTLNGLIHEVRFWNLERTQSQIMAAKNSYLTGTETGLIGYWRMNDNAGQLVNDLSPTNNDGYLGSATGADVADPVYATACFCTAPAATVTPSGPTTFCAGGSVLLTGNGGAGITYQWKKNGVNIAGATLQTYTATTAGIYTLEVTLGGCTSNSAYVNVVVNQSLSPSITENGFGGFCSSSTVTLDVSSNGVGSSYQWFEENSPIPNATGTSVSTWHNGNYHVTVTNGCGTFTSPVYPLNNFLFNSYNVHTINAQGATTFCSGGSVQMGYTGFFPYGNGVYQWYKNGVEIAGATSMSYLATQSGTYFLSVYGENWDQWQGPCQTPTVFSNPIVVTENVTPSAAITVSGATTFCAGGSVTLSAPVANNRSYQWLKGGVAIAGATSSVYVATAGGSYKLRVTNTVTGCAKTTATGITVIVNAAPAATITPQGPTTFCAGGSVVFKANSGTNYTYKWKKGANYINQATNKNYTATVAGNYRVVVTNANGCSTTSTLVSVSVPCREGEPGTGSAQTIFDFNIYPNPAYGAFTIKFAGMPSSPVTVDLTDVIGKTIKRFTVADESILVDKLNVSDGIYYIAAYNEQGRVVKKVVINR